MVVPVSDKTEDKKWLLELAGKRIRGYKFRIHTIVFLLILGILLSFNEVSVAREADVLHFGLFLGAWITLYAVHAFSYFRSRDLAGIKSSGKTKGLARLKNGIEK